MTTDSSFTNGTTYLSDISSALAHLHDRGLVATCPYFETRLFVVVQCDNLEQLVHFKLADWGKSHLRRCCSDNKKQKKQKETENEASKMISLDVNRDEIEDSSSDCDKTRVKLRPISSTTISSLNRATLRGAHNDLKAFGQLLLEIVPFHLLRERGNGADGTEKNQNSNNMKALDQLDDLIQCCLNSNQQNVPSFHASAIR